MKNPNCFTHIIFNDVYFDYHKDEFNDIDQNLFYNSFKQYYSHDKQNNIILDRKRVGLKQILNLKGFTYSSYKEFLETFKCQCLDYDTVNKIAEKYDKMYIETYE